MSQWYRPSISNVSVHEVWPGHYVQFLFAKDYPSDVRKVFATSSNFEGWAITASEWYSTRVRTPTIRDTGLGEVRMRCFRTAITRWAS